MSETATTDTTTTTGTEPGSSTPAEPKMVTLSQEKLDRIIASRIAETKSSYADYDDLKSKASKLDELERAQLSDRERIERERDEAKAAADAAKAEAASTLLEAQRTLVAAKAGLPDELGALLKGDTKEELEAHAETLKAFAKAPEPTPTAEDGVTPTGQRREQPAGMTREQIQKLAKENPVEFNRKLEAGEISLAQL